jgi:hypothetical protein
MSADEDANTICILEVSSYWLRTIQINLVSQRNDCVVVIKLNFKHYLSQPVFKDYIFLYIQQPNP